jgi:hypothetical protein
MKGQAMATTTKQQQTKPPAKDPIAAAEQVLAALEQDRRQLVSARAADDAEMSKHAFAAHALHELGATERLGKITERAIERDGRLRSLDCAIFEARERLAAAKAAEARAADRQKAEEALTLLHETGRCFEYLDKHLNEAVRALTAIDNGFAQLRQSGFVISDTSDRIGITAIIQSWAHRIPRRWHEQLRDNFEFLAPGARRTAIEHWTRMRASIDNQITARLGEGERNTEAA